MSDTQTVIIHLFSEEHGLLVRHVLEALAIAFNPKQIGSDLPLML